jgi:hypothetical protein
VVRPQPDQTCTAMTAARLASQDEAARVAAVTRHPCALAVPAGRADRSARPTDGKPIGAVR